MTVLDVTAASGTVTIELEAGQPQPTFVTAGASVTFTEPPTTLNILRPNFLSGSTYVLRNTTQDTEISAGTVGVGGLDLTLTSGVEYTSGDQLDLRVGCVSGATAKLPIQELLTAPEVTAVNSSPASQQDYTVYNSLGIDGSSRTEFTADYVNNQVDIIVASDFFGQNFMAWWVYNEATLNGLRNFLGSYTLLDEGNARNNVDVVSVKFDNITASNIKQIDNARIFASDESYPVLNPSTGGGAIDINWRVPVQIINVEGSPVVTGSLEDVAGRVWNAALASYQTAGSTGEALDAAAGGGGGGGGATAQEVWEYATRTLTASSDPSAAAIATAVRSELATEIGRIDVAVSSRNATVPDNAGIAAIKAKTDLVTIAGGYVEAVAKSVEDKVGYSLTSGERVAVATAVEAALLNEGDGQQLIDAIVQAIGNQNVDQIALVAAIRADIERAGGSLAGVATKDDLTVVNDGVKKASILVPHSDDIAD